MVFIFLFIQIIVFASISKQSQAVLCYDGFDSRNELNKKASTILIEADSCSIYGTLYSDGEMRTLIFGFNNSDALPDDYKKPKSGSDFIELNYFILENQLTNLFTFRYFCYKDECNQLDLIQKFIEAKVKFMNLEFSQPLTKCFTCNGETYDSVKNCTNTESCLTTCMMKSSIIKNDLFSFWDWSSSCFPSSGVYAQLQLQYEIQTKLLNVYPNVICGYEECSSYNFIDKFTNSVEFLF